MNSTQDINQPSKAQINLAVSHTTAYSALRQFSQENQFIISRAYMPGYGAFLIRLLLYAPPENDCCGILDLNQVSHNQCELILNPRPYPDMQRKPTREQIEYYLNFCGLALDYLRDLGFLPLSPHTESPLKLVRQMAD